MALRTPSHVNIGRTLDLWLTPTTTSVHWKMSKQKVFLLGSLGETGSSILEALIEDGSFV
jgi:hypothetical protein